MKYSTLIVPLTGLLLSAITLSGCDSGSNTNTGSESHSGQHTQQHNEEQNQDTETGQARSVHLTQQQISTLGIQVDTLDQGSATSTIVRPATVTYDMDQIAKVGPRIEAKVVKVLKDLGDRVSKEEPIVLMSSVELGKIKAKHLKLKAKLKTEKAHYEREQSLYKQEISSKAELLEAEAHYEEAKANLNASVEALRLYGLTQSDVKSIEAGSDQPLSYFQVSSPLNGVIQKRDLSPGQTVGPDETPIHVVGLSKMWVMIDAYEQDIPHIKQGQSIQLSVRSLPNETFEGKADWISYALEEDTRTMPVRAVIPNPDRQLRSGMYGTARINTSGKQTTALIPIDAVQTIDGKDMVFVPGKESGGFHAKPVLLGDENEGFVEITSGLQPGDSAVVAGAFDLKSALTSGSRSAAHNH